MDGQGWSIGQEQTLPAVHPGTGSQRSIFWPDTGDRQPSLAICPWHEDLFQKKQQQQLGYQLPGPELQKVVTIGRSVSRAS